MDAHRCIAPTNIEFVPAAKGFSSFDFVGRFQGLSSLHRCFSLARSFKVKTLVIEQIAPAGLIKDENDELSSLFPNHVAGALLRLSFWRSAFKELDTVEDDALLGYAIVKQDKPSPKATGGWHLFEAVFRKYEHEHNCIPCLRPYRIHVGDREFLISGRLYCQQNAMNKACAQVALRSLLSGCLPDGDISYRRINELSTSTAKAGWTPAKGLSSVQIRSVLDQLHIGYRDIDYVESENADPDIRRTHPFQKFLYAGVESGAGALLGFSLAGPGLQEPGKHIIPFFGHTFNKDTWVPEAEQSYFEVGGGVGYIPSESWTSSFLGHDDNFGPNFCVPRLYVKPEQVDYVSELLPSGARFSGVAAEAVSMRFVYSLHPNITHAKNPWLRRLAYFADPKVQKVILRAVFATKKQYVAHLRNATDWDNSTENPQLLDLLEKGLPEGLWVVEVSLPHLFPANERKLGEVVLNAAYPMNAANSLSFDAFCLARLPTRYFLVRAVTKGKPQFSEVPSALKSHVPLLRI